MILRPRQIGRRARQPPPSSAAPVQGRREAGSAGTNRQVPPPTQVPPQSVWGPCPYHCSPANRRYEVTPGRVVTAAAPLWPPAYEGDGVCFCQAARSDSRSRSNSAPVSWRVWGGFAVAAAPLTTRLIRCHSGTAPGLGDQGQTALGLGETGTALHLDAEDDCSSLRRPFIVLSASPRPSPFLPVPAADAPSCGHISHGAAAPCPPNPRRLAADEVICRRAALMALLGA